VSGERLASVYARLPTGAQHAAVTAYGAWWRWLRFGPGYKAEVRRYESREQWTAERWRDWQDIRVAEVLTAAVARVPQYSDAWDGEQRKAAGRGELDGVPILEKHTLADHPDRLLDPQARPRRPLVFSTSGSSGTPVSTHWTVPELRSSLAVREVRSARWAGVSFTLPRVTFSGRMIEPRSDGRSTPHRYNAAEHQVYLSAFHLTPETAPDYLSAIARHGSQWGTGYASSFRQLARYTVDGGLDAPKLTAVVTTSEKTSNETRELVQAAFGCRTFEEYSSVENSALATECVAGSLHVSPDVGVIEIVRADGTACDPGEVGDVVTTTLMRRFQPLIRYRLGDRAAWAEDDGCACGREMPVLSEVVGRLEDELVGADGRRLTRIDQVFRELPGVHEGQIVQHRPGDFTVRVMADERFDGDAAATLAQRIRDRLGDVIVRVTTDEALERTPSGKVKFVVDRSPTQ